MDIFSTPIQLIESSQNEDVSSMSIVQNKNSETLVSYVTEIIEYLRTSQGGSGESITQQVFNTMLQNAKNSVILQAGMTNNQYVDFNGYRLKRIGIAPNTSGGILFQITDIDSSRNTNFRNMNCIVRSFAGQTVFPLIIAELTHINIIFGSSLDVALISATPATDANNKRITIF